MLIHFKFKKQDEKIFKYEYLINLEINKISFFLIIILRFKIISEHQI